MTYNEAFELRDGYYEQLIGKMDESVNQVISDVVVVPDDQSNAFWIRYKEAGEITKSKMYNKGALGFLSSKTYSVFVVYKTTHLGKLSYAPIEPIINGNFRY